MANVTSEKSSVVLTKKQYNPLLPDELKDKPILIVIHGGGFRQIENAVGILKAIEQLRDLSNNEIYYHAASAGAPIAAFHCSGMRGTDLETVVRSTATSDLIKLDLFQTIKKFIPFNKSSYVYNNKGMYNFIKKYTRAIAAKYVEVSVTRMDTFTSHMMPATPETILASTSIPEVFPPVKIGDYYYVDGGIKNNCPLNLKVNRIQNGFYMDYRHIYVILCPFTTTSTYTSCDLLLTRIAYLINETMDREIAQIHGDGWDKLYNCTIIQPQAYEDSCLLDWSPGYGLINHSYTYAIDKLNKEYNWWLDVHSQNIINEGSLI